MCIDLGFGNSCIFNDENFKKRLLLLKKCVDEDEYLQEVVLDGIQVGVTLLKHPPGSDVVILLVSVKRYLFQQYKLLLMVAILDVIDEVCVFMSIVLKIAFQFESLMHQPENCYLWLLHDFLALCYSNILLKTIWFYNCSKVK